MLDFFGQSLEGLQELFAASGLPRFRARQAFEAVYKHKFFEPSLFPSLDAQTKNFLAENFSFATGKLVGGARSAGDAKKYLFALSDGNFVESVMLCAPAGGGKTRNTLCVSTQVGCASGCKFCASAMRGFVRNLTSGEILSQLVPFVRAASGESRGRVFDFENIVVMGMGEPLANFDNLLAALEVLNSPDKFAFGARRITVSTCGLADKIRRLAEIKFPFRLAISLHGATDEVRSQIMPINKKFPIAEVVAAARLFAETCGRMLTLEYILIDGVNDSFAQAHKLAEIAKELHAHVNLIPYNPVEGLPWRRSPAARRKAFAGILEIQKVSHTLRREKGAEIDAACGQLALKRSRAEQ